MKSLFIKLFSKKVPVIPVVPKEDPWKYIQTITITMQNESIYRYTSKFVKYQSLFKNLFYRSLWIWFYIKESPIYTITTGLTDQEDTQIMNTLKRSEVSSISSKIIPIKKEIKHDHNK